MRRVFSFVLAAGLIAASAMVAAQAPQSPAPPQQPLPKPAFATKAELVLVDVNVVDRDARPVPTLADTDFSLEVNGQTRKIQSVQYISTVAPETTPSSPREAAYTSNETATTGRLLLFVVDESNLRVGSNRAILRTAQSLFTRLAPGDLIALARLPTGAGNVEFTADRKRISDGLMRVTGAMNPRVGMMHVNISEAWALENNDPGTFQEAVARECNGSNGAELEACQNQLEADARSMLLETSARSRTTLSALETLMRNLIPLKTPVNVVLISEGLFVARDRQSMAGLGRAAAEARATIHVIRPSQSFFDVDERAPSGGMSRFFDDGLMNEGLEQVAGQTRGSMSIVSGDGATQFDRLGRELSGYYLVGFEPTDADRTGKERRIKIDVKPRGLTVRARPTFVVPAAESEKATASMTPMDQLGEVLKSPLPVRGLPLRVLSYNAIETGTNKVRVVVTAEAGEPASAPADWPVGVVILDKNDKIVFNRGGVSTLQPASRGVDSPRLILTSVALDPGEYTMRIGAVDDHGRGGSVHYSINAKLTRINGSVNVGDLILVSQPPNAGDVPRPRPSGVIDSETVTAMLEMSGTDQALLGKTHVTLQVSDATDGTALINVEAKQASRGTNTRAFAATMRLGVLPPGEYIARAIIAAPGHPETRLTRPFLLQPTADAPTDVADLNVPLDPDAPPPPVAASKILAPVPGFSARSVLVPEVVQPFLDGLVDTHPPSPEVEAVMEKAKNGDYNAPAERGATPDDELNLAFVRGLDALSKDQVAQAAAWFQQILKGASDFLGAAFYLGVTHAVSGRDKEAIGAWQMALLSDNPGAVYPALVDALLRTGDGRQALDVLEEAPDAWANDDDRLKREAVALAMIGDYSGALPKLKDQLDNTSREDQPMLFVAIQVLFKMYQQDKSLSPDNLDHFRKYVERHQKLGGPNRALVETWRKAVLGR